jgi:hypothetical protein
MLPKTFRMQVSYALFSGSILVLIGLLKSNEGGDASAFLGFGLAILVIGAVVRPIQRWLWLRSVRSGDVERVATAERLLQGRFGGLWREWLDVPSVDRSDTVGFHASSLRRDGDGGDG